MMLEGAGVSKGIAIGKAVIIDEAESKGISAFHGSERKRVELAVNSFSKEIGELIKELDINEEKELYEIAQGQLALLNDPCVLPAIIEKAENGFSAEKAVETVLCSLEQQLENAEDELIKKRAGDLEDVKKRLLRLLGGTSDMHFDSLPCGSVAVFKSPLPSLILQLKSKLAAAVCETGGAVSHAAILLRAAGIPAVFSAEGCCKKIKNGDAVIVDGTDGKILVNPSRSLMKEYSDRKPESILSPNQSRLVYGNICCAEEARQVLRLGGAGIGLFRTEFLFDGRKLPPSEEEQLKEYKTAASEMQGKEVVIRLIDVGGDKQPSSLKQSLLPNERGIRFCLSNIPLLKTQLRAVLRSAAAGNVKLLLPMITVPGEIERVRAIIEKCVAELEAEELAYRRVPLGVMIETPSAAILSDLLAKKSDFFSVGTNDLNAYIMAESREAAGISLAENIAVLRSIETVIKNAKKERIAVSVCGEAAADSDVIPLLLKWGADSLSVSPPLIPSVQAITCNAII